MRSSSFLILAIFLVLGTLALQAAGLGVPHKGQEAGKGHDLVKRPVKGQYPVKTQDLVQTPRPPRVQTKPGTCPLVLMRCAMMNPPNACMRDSECQGTKKCCTGSCGRVCLRPM